MDSLSLIMFSFVFMLGFIFLILGFAELKETLAENKKGTPATPAMGLVYFSISMLIWFVVSMYWPAMATDPALGTLGLLWYGFAWISVAAVATSLGYILKGTFKETERDKLEIREEEWT